MKKLMETLCVLAATGFGFGYSPVASGTVGALWGVLIVWRVFPLIGWKEQAVFSILLALLAVPICHVAEKVLGKKDDGRIVADEYLTFPICMIGLPAANPWMLATAFVTSRIFDIVKPPPARGLQRIKGGAGIVIDDVFACCYSLLLNWALYFLILKRIGLAA